MRCCHFQFLKSLSLPPWFWFLLEYLDWMRRVSPQMMQGQARFNIHLDGILATIALAASPNRIKPRRSMKHGTSASTSAVRSPGTNRMGLVERPVVIQMYSSRLRSPVRQLVNATTFADSNSLESTIGISIEAIYIPIDIIETAFVFTTGTNVSYSIDGVQRGTAVRNPANRNAYIYNQSLFSISGLTNVEHTLRVDLLKPSVLLVYPSSMIHRS
jgi:hypothetical protein